MCLASCSTFEGTSPKLQHQNHGRADWRYYNISETGFLYLILVRQQCSTLVAPDNGTVSNLASQPLNVGDIQLITCDADFRANGSTEFTCTEVNETSTEWQPAPGLTTCGKI